MTTESEKFLNLFEARFYEFGRRIADFESHKEEFKRLGELLQVTIQRLEASIKEGYLKEEESSKKAVALDKYLAYLAERIAGAIENIASLETHKEKSVQEHAEMKRQHVISGEKHAESEKKMDAFSKWTAQLQQRVKSIEDCMQNLQSQISVIQGISEDLKAKDSTHVLGFSSIKTDLNAQKTELRSLLDAIRLSEGKMQDGSRALALSFDSKLAEIPSLINQKFATIVIPDVSKFAEKVSVALAERTAELAALDAKNAFLKSNNIEMQQQLLNKKIEQIQILLKSLEYSNASK